MANRKLAAAVHIGGKWYRPGDDVPDDVAEQITNPKVWAATAEDAVTTGAPRVEPGTTSGARLAGRVSVAGRWYGPYDAVPDDVAAQITNPKAWEGGKLPTLQEAAPSGEREVTAGTATVDTAQGADTEPAEPAAADTAAEPDTDAADEPAPAERPSRRSSKRG